LFHAFAGINNGFNAGIIIFFRLGLAEKSFNLDRLAELPGSLPVEKFRGWVASAPEKLLAAIEHAVNSAR